MIRIEINKMFQYHKINYYASKGSAYIQFYIKDRIKYHENYIQFFLNKPLYTYLLFVSDMMNLVYLKNFMISRTRRYYRKYKRLERKLT